MVFLDAPGMAGRPEAVTYDCTAAVRDLAALLAERGHRTVAYLDAATRSATFRQRRELLGEALAARGLRLLGDEVRAELDVDSARSAAARHLARWRGEGATAVVGAADTLAYGVLSAAREARVRVPEDLGVAGFDDLPSSAITAPALTSISLPGAVMGRVAAERLLAALEGRGTPDVGPLGARLVRRESL
ncbi:substrate-binding domain-containing protein [Rothia sp. AR01]|uniref:Substrate-binding domain-containing protein n=1 Tax=Rothia santali TaxID=2949643 RepID=A0A9X2KHV4_9MICC|nr:substrate-binding domain-containing protein [Rothia santali]MCP3425320.1 substrate-binding domain-containing protein [Rothia santali]